MNCAVMRAAEGDGKFITRLAAKRARLHKSDVVGVRGFAAAQHACLLGYKAKMVPVAIAARGGNGKHAFIDAGGLGGLVGGQRRLGISRGSCGGAG
jgi:hypothetical protein